MTKGLHFPASFLLKIYANTIFIVLAESLSNTLENLILEQCSNRVVVAVDECTK